MLCVYDCSLLVSGKSVILFITASVVYRGREEKPKMEGEKNTNTRRRGIVLRVDEDLHTQIKTHVAINKTTLQDYIVALIIADLARTEPDPPKKRGH